MHLRCIYKCISKHRKDRAAQMGPGAQGPGTRARDRTQDPKARAQGPGTRTRGPRARDQGPGPDPGPMARGPRARDQGPGPDPGPKGPGPKGPGPGPRTQRPGTQGPGTRARDRTQDPRAQTFKTTNFLPVLRGLLPDLRVHLFVHTRIYGSTSGFTGPPFCKKVDLRIRLRPEETEENLRF